MSFSRAKQVPRIFYVNKQAAGKKWSIQHLKFDISDIYLGFTERKAGFVKEVTACLTLWNPEGASASGSAMNALIPDPSLTLPCLNSLASPSALSIRLPIPLTRTEKFEGCRWSSRAPSGSARWWALTWCVAAVRDWNKGQVNIKKS